MTLRDMLDTLKQHDYRIQVRDRNNYEIGTFPQTSGGLNPYLDKEIVFWMPKEFDIDNSVIVVSIKE